MFGSLLIANRGEIARRVIRTARRMGLRTIAVFSDADAEARHVREADAAFRIGPAAPRQSYLDADAVLAAARESGAEAIHPGYGFLSENADFAEAVAKAGLIWIGPPPSAIRAMGLKSSAKALMAAAGVPVTPGYHGEDQDPARLAEEAARIGWPVLIKAVAGGGGRGMRKVEAADAFKAALESCRREALQGFGDERVLLERYVRSPRHIEVQVFADAHGRTYTLFERDCSLQRRHQKLIEEAPAPGLSPDVRETICAAAAKAAAAVGYQGAGTVEFIADGSGPVSAERTWFMEMNTRLQVEHPVTEAVTGLDLVEWQIRVAAGEPLPERFGPAEPDGWAIEARICAETPRADFLPAVGRIDHLRLPEGVRVDSAVEAGSEVTPHYDSMIAKLIAHGPDRASAARRLAEACRALEVYPLRTNAAFLARCLGHADFLAGRIDTGFIAERLDSLVGPAEPPAPVLEAAARAFARPAGDGPFDALAGFRINRDPGYALRLQGEGGPWQAEVAGPPVRALPRAEGFGEEVVVFDVGEAWRFQAGEAAGADGEDADEDRTLSPMPGRVVAVHTAAGQAVRRGDPIATLEAMKMEHVLTAAADGVLAVLAVSVGDQVSEGALIARVEVEAEG